MTVIHSETWAACPPERVWRVLADLETVQHYNPGVREAKVQGELRSGVGARRACELRPRGRVVERVTHWEVGHALGLELEVHDWPVDFMRWVTRVEAHSGGTRLTQILEYRVKFGPLGWLLDQTVMRRKLTATLDDVFASLRCYAEGAALLNTSPDRS